ncbi:hypothetical protein M569_04170, partial [Genlisea aurea]
ESIGSSGRFPDDDDGSNNDDALAIMSYQAKEEEIEKMKLEVRKKVESRITRAEEEAKRLTQVWEELEGFTDPTRKELSLVRKRLDVAAKELKTLSQICHKKEKEYREAMEAYQERSKEKAQLTAALVELMNQSEKYRMRKLEDFTKLLTSKQ